MSSSDSRDERTRGGAGGTSNLGESSIEIGADGVSPAIGLGSGLTMDVTGDLGLRVAPGVSIDLTPGS